MIKDNLITTSWNGTVIGAHWVNDKRAHPDRSQGGVGTMPRVIGNQFINNRIAVRLTETANPTQIVVQHNNFQGNVVYSIYNANEEVVLNASTNEWAGGLPASPDPANPLQDPYSGVLADGSGGAVSEGAVDGHSNVHFCEESRENCLDPPAVDALLAAEVETPNADAEFTADWAVSDDGDNLESVELTLFDDTTNETEDTASIAVSGGNETGTTRLVGPGDDGAGHSYTIELTVTDGYGSTATVTTSINETEASTPTPTETPTLTPTPPPTNGTANGSGSGPSGSGTNGGGEGSDSGQGDGSSDDSSRKETPGRIVETAETTTTTTATATSPPPLQVTPTPEIVPGFGVGVGAVAVVLIVGLLGLRRRRD